MLSQKLIVLFAFWKSFQFFNIDVFKSQIFVHLYVLDWFVEPLDWLLSATKSKHYIQWLDTFECDWPALSMLFGEYTYKYSLKKETLKFSFLFNEIPTNRLLYFYFCLKMHFETVCICFQDLEIEELIKLKGQKILLSLDAIIFWSKYFP